MYAPLRSIAPGLALALLATAASAADLPARRAPVYAPPPIPVFTWTGFYVGAQAGYEFGRSNGALVVTPALAAIPGNQPAGTVVVAGGVPVINSGSKNGVIGGGHVGYLFSTQSLPVIGSFFGGNGAYGFGTGGVFGIEGDVDGSSARTNYVFPNSNLASGARERIQGSIRGRLGIAFDRALFYATGGAAFGSLQYVYLQTATGAVDAFNRTRVGYTVGGGVEYAFTNNLSARVEYRYTDFGSFSNPLNNITGGFFAIQQRETDNRVQAGLSYRFDTFTPAPVVARY